MNSSKKALVFQTKQMQKNKIFLTKNEQILNVENKNLISKINIDVSMIENYNYIPVEKLKSRTIKNLEYFLI